MGRTLPSFRLAQMREEQEWKEFRRPLSKSEKKAFDSMLATSRLYMSACSYANKPVRVQPPLTSIILHHYRQLEEIERAMGGSDQRACFQTRTFWKKRSSRGAGFATA